MPIKAIVKTIDDVEEGLRPLYKQDGDHFILDVEASGGFALENVEGLKTTVGKLRQENGNHLSALKRYEGLDPDEARSAISKVAEFTNLDPKKEADRIAEMKIREATDQLKGIHSKEIGTVSKRNEVYKARLVKFGRDDEIDRALTALEAKGHKLLPGARDDLKVILSRNINHALDEDTGLVKITVHDGDGIPKIKNSNGDLMTIADFVETLPTNKANFFEAHDTGGSGQRKPGGGGGGGGGATGKQRSKMTAAERSAYIRDNGVDKFLALPQ